MVSTPDAPRGTWRKSSYSGNQGECVESAALAAGVGVRDTKDPSVGHLEVRPAAWAALLERLATA
jgi:hypothetical protein